LVLGQDDGAGLARSRHCPRSPSVELCTVYWRYLLLVWLVLLALLAPAVSELCRGRFLG